MSVALAGWGLASLFRQHITQQLRAELTLHLNQLTAAVNIGPDGRPVVAPPLSDPRLEQPLSGLYWQIDRLGRGQAARGGRRGALAVALGPDAGGARARTARATGITTIARAGRAALSRAGAHAEAGGRGRGAAAAAGGGRPGRCWPRPIGRFNAYAGHRAGRAGGRADRGAIVQVLVGLRPLARLRRKLAAQNAGDGNRIEGRFPAKSSRWSTTSNKVPWQ